MDIKHIELLSLDQDLALLKNLIGFVANPSLVTGEDFNFILKKLRDRKFFKPNEIAEIIGVKKGTPTI